MVSACGTVTRLAGLLAVGTGLWLMGWGPFVCLRGCVLEGQLKGSPVALPLRSCANPYFTHHAKVLCHDFASLHCGQVTSITYPRKLASADLGKARMGLDGQLAYSGSKSEGLVLAGVFRPEGTMKLAVTSVVLAGVAAVVGLVSLALPCAVRPECLRAVMAVSLSVRCLLVAAAALTASLGAFSRFWQGHSRLYTARADAPWTTRVLRRGWTTRELGEGTGDTEMVVGGWLLASLLFVLGLVLTLGESLTLCCRPCYEVDEESRGRPAAGQPLSPVPGRPQPAPAPTAPPTTPAQAAAPAPATRAPTAVTFVDDDPQDALSPDEDKEVGPSCVVVLAAFPNPHDPSSGLSDADGLPASDATDEDDPSQPLRPLHSLSHDPDDGLDLPTDTSRRPYL